MSNAELWDLDTSGGIMEVSELPVTVQYFFFLLILGWFISFQIVSHSGHFIC